MVTIEDHSLLKHLIGKQIIGIGSTDQLFYDGHIESVEINFVINLGEYRLLIDCDFRVGFFESQNGYIFYDYNLKYISSDSYKSECYVAISSSPITRIEVMGRELDPFEFINLPELHQQIKKNKKTDDLLLMTCREGNQFLLVLDPIFPKLRFIFVRNEIVRFLHEHNEIYALHFIIE